MKAFSMDRHTSFRSVPLGDAHVCSTEMRADIQSSLSSQDFCIAVYRYWYLYKKFQRGCESTRSYTMLCGKGLSLSLMRDVVSIPMPASHGTITVSVVHFPIPTASEEVRLSIYLPILP